MVLSGKMQEMSKKAVSACFYILFKKGWCQWGDLNPQALNRRQILSLLCIPIPPH